MIVDCLSKCQRAFATETYLHGATVCDMVGVEGGAAAALASKILHDLLRADEASRHR